MCYDFFMSFISFILHESPQHSCLSEAAPDLAPSFFIVAHESPQQHSPLSEEAAWFFIAPSFFIEHESPQQQHSCLSVDAAWFFITPSFVIGHESLQQQHESIFLPAPDCVAFCAKPTPARVIIKPSIKPGTKRRNLFMKFLLLRK